MVLMLTAVSGVALFQYLELREKAGLAKDKFYAMEELELHIVALESELEQACEETRSARGDTEREAPRRGRLAKLRASYNASASVYAHERQASRFLPGRFPPPDSVELLILRLARIFGETEAAVPQAFIAEVKEIHREVAVVRSSVERNFWQLLRRHKIPEGTYEYVFHIFSAAVICENLSLFGFGFDNPLTHP